MQVMISEMPMHQGRVLPRFTLRQIDLPDIARWPINSAHYIVMKVEVVAKRNNKDLDLAPESDKVKIDGDLQVISVKALGNEPVDAKALERADFEKTIAEAKSENNV